MDSENGRLEAGAEAADCHLYGDSLGNDSRLRPAFSWKRVMTAAAVAAPLVAAGVYLLPLSPSPTHCAILPMAERGQRLLQGNSAFDLSKLSIPRGQVLAGGPPKDGIPALTNPAVLDAKDAGFLRPNDRVIGFTAGGVSRAYPLRILNYHEVVNDVVGDVDVAITYCPLCDSVAAIDRRAASEVREFGVSGLLYHSNVLMYDRSDATESLWSQLMFEGVSGPGAKQRLAMLPVELTTWADWRDRHPQTTVLSTETGHRRDYGRSPYAGYFDSPRLMFPVQITSELLPVKQPVLGVWTATGVRAYPTSAFTDDRTEVDDVVGDKKVKIVYSPGADSLRVAAADEGVFWAYSLWFAWYAFHPETEVFE